MSTFASTFREIVVPKLRRWVEMEAVCVARGIETYGDAFATVYREANSMGASHLPKQVHDDLVDWIAAKLLVEIDTVERLGAQ